MKKITKKRIFKGTTIALALTTLIGISSNIKKDGRYNFSYNNAIVKETNLEGLGSYVLQGGCTDGTYKYLTAYDST